MSKIRNEKLIKWADEALRATPEVLNVTNGTIDDSYNGQVAALGVMIAMSGLRPALAIYYQDNDQNKPHRRAVLEVIARMISRDQDNSYPFRNAEEMFRYVLGNEANLKELRREITECATALKQVVRTYNLTGHV